MPEERLQYGFRTRPKNAEKTKTVPDIPEEKLQAVDKAVVELQLSKRRESFEEEELEEEEVEEEEEDFTPNRLGYSDIGYLPAKHKEPRFTVQRYEQPKSSCHQNNLPQARPGNCGFRPGNVIIQEGRPTAVPIDEDQLQQEDLQNAEIIDINFVDGQYAGVGYDRFRRHLSQAIVDAVRKAAEDAGSTAKGVENSEAFVADNVQKTEEGTSGAEPAKSVTGEVGTVKETDSETGSSKVNVSDPSVPSDEKESPQTRVDSDGHLIPVDKTPEENFASIDEPASEIKINSTSPTFITEPFKVPSDTVEESKPSYPSETYVAEIDPTSKDLLPQQPILIPQPDAPSVPQQDQEPPVDPSVPTDSNASEQSPLITDRQYFDRISELVAKLSASLQHIKDQAFAKDILFVPNPQMMHEAVVVDQQQKLQDAAAGLPQTAEQNRPVMMDDGGNADQAVYIFQPASPTETQDGTIEGVHHGEEVKVAE